MVVASNNPVMSDASGPSREAEAAGRDYPCGCRFAPAEAMMAPWRSKQERSADDYWQLCRVIINIELEFRPAALPALN